MLFYGEKDQFILAEHAANFTGRLKQLGKNFSSHVYAGAGHGFFCNDRASYNADAAQDAWEKTTSFLETNLKRAKAGVR